ncbi:hypothetical protein FKM82_030902 [Ascaphus truei]
MPVNSLLNFPCYFAGLVRPKSCLQCVSENLCLVLVATCQVGLALDRWIRLLLPGQASGHSPNRVVGFLQLGCCGLPPLPPVLADLLSQ